ncbi:hypothetical protein E2C01_000267 [Portunus trituberculatus]|uniref:Uncharacterized protein n=1 Tax=Portunus trituberculatus TaxID=210409 RepID=A0A5B7CDM7_PORTR|nr:hypothetical protein [Portunus trituberculatus]
MTSQQAMSGMCSSGGDLPTGHIRDVTCWLATRNVTFCMERREKNLPASLGRRPTHPPAAPLSFPNVAPATALLTTIISCDI